MDAVQEIKQRLAIDEVVGQYVELKRAGRNFKGLSPFNSEKTPSFVVSPEKQIWHDFSSGKGGDIFSFVMEMEGLDFKGALELLARKAGVELEQYGGSSNSNTKLKKRLYEALDLAAKFYQVQFSKSQTALDYVIKKRKFNKQVALDFRLGYSPNNGRALIDFLTKKGFSESEITKAGLTSERYGKINDMFRGRLMVPLMDASGRVIGFTARLLEDIDNAPKYINTPQTILYDKSRHVFGLYLAKESIRKEKIAVLVEGNLDVIASHQVGVKNVVATAGTALTEDHLKTIGRLASDVRLAFDADRAGLSATERSIPIASKVGVSLSVITIDEAKDPDELIQKDPKLWSSAISKNKYALDWLIKHYIGMQDINSGRGKRAFSDAILPTIKDLSDSVEQDHYLSKVAKIIDVSTKALREKMESSQKTVRLKRGVQEVAKIQGGLQLEWAKAQDHFLAIVLMRPGLRELLSNLEGDMLVQENATKLFDYLVAHPDFDGDLKKAPILSEVTDYVKILSLQYEALFDELDEVEAEYEAKRLRARLIDIYVKVKKSQISEALKEASDKESLSLLSRVKALDNLLKLSKEGN